MQGEYKSFYQFVSVCDYGYYKPSYTAECIRCPDSNDIERHDCPYCFPQAGSDTCGNRDYTPNSYKLTNIPIL